VRLETLRLQHFRQHADTTVAFDAGLTGIIGANGSGKSTLLEAIAWALYGMPAARGTKDSIRSLRAPARAAVKVELVFTLAGHRYRVERTLTSASVWLDGGEAPVAQSLSGVTEYLQQRLGMTREEFSNTYFTGQKQLGAIAAMAPSERGQFLSRVLGYERLRAAQEQVRERRKLLVAELAGMQGGLRDPAEVQAAVDAAATRRAVAARAAADAASTLDAARRAVAAEAPRFAAATAARERAIALEAERRSLAAERSGLETLAARIGAELAEAETARTALESLEVELAPLAERRTSLAALDALARDDGRRQALGAALAALDQDLAEREARRAALAAAPGLEASVAAELAAAADRLGAAERDLEARRTEWVRDRQEAETRRADLRKQYLELQAQRARFVELGEQATCPTCQRPLGESFRALIDALDEQLEAVEVDGRYFKARTEQLADPPAEVAALDEARRAAALEVSHHERRLAKVQAGLQELAAIEAELAEKRKRRAATAAELAALPQGYDAARHAALRQEVDELTRREAEAAVLRAKAARAEVLGADAQRLAGQRAALDERLAAVARELADAGDAEATWRAARDAYDAAQAGARAAELAHVQAVGERQAAEEQAARAEAVAAEQATLRARHDALVADRRLHDELDRTFADLRTDLNARLRPELSELASAFLAELTDGRYGMLELDEQYALLVLEDGIPKPVISGGEEDLANLVLRLAISQMIAERSGQSFSLLVLDEVFGSLDEARRQHVVGLLRRLQDRFEQVVLITHVDDVREGLDRVIEVRYDAERGVSVVSQDAAAGAAVPAFEPAGAA
jgi:exonuclease SbcC